MSCQLALKVYRLTEKFPQHEIFGITSQMRRSAVSIASNIAEGAGRQSSKEFLNFLSIALGSLFELQTQFYLSKNLGYGGAELSENLDKEMRGLACGLNSFIASLRRSP